MSTHLRKAFRALLLAARAGHFICINKMLCYGHKKSRSRRRLCALVIVDGGKDTTFFLSNKLFADFFQKNFYLCRKKFAMDKEQVDIKELEKRLKMLEYFTFSIHRALITIAIIVSIGLIAIWLQLPK